MRSTGTIITLSMFLVAVALGVFSVWYHHRQTADSLAFWGPQAARLLAGATQVELFKIAALPADSNAATADEVGIGGSRYQLLDRRELSQARGLTHMRTALLTDASFAWDRAPPTSQPRWEYALRFTGDEATATVAISLADARLALASPDARIVAIDPIVRGLTTFLEEQYAPPESKTNGE